MIQAHGTTDVWDATRLAGVVPYPPDVQRSYVAAGAWTTETLGDSLHQAAQLHSVRLAVVTPSQRLTFRELDELSDRFGSALLGLGLIKGQRVLCQLTNTADAVVAYYGIVKAGLVPVCTIAQHGERDMREIAARTNPAAYMFQRGSGTRDLGRVAANVANDSASIRLLIGVGSGRGLGLDFSKLVDAVGAAEARQTVEKVQVAPTDVAVLQLSGGTTGTPKLIPRLQCDYLYNSRQWASTVGWDTATVVLHPIPLLHNAGLSVAMQPAHFSGSTFVTIERPEVSRVLDLIERERVSVIPVTPPALLKDLLDEQQRQPRDLSSLREIIVAGQRLDRQLAQRLEDQLEIRCLQKFGMAEGMFLFTPRDAPEWVRMDTVGSPISAFDEVRILEPGTETEVDVGDVGELCCRGPYTVRGYYNEPARNAEAFTSDGFYRTGDLARAQVFRDGSVYSVEGRIKDTINRGGEKISAEEVESVLLLHPSIDAVAVVAMPDARLVERACAYVVVAKTRPTPSLEDVVSFCVGQGMARFKLPERIQRTDVLPLTNIGKVAKQKLRDDIARLLALEQDLPQRKEGT